jgi:hypothetical protein
MEIYGPWLHFPSLSYKGDGVRAKMMQENPFLSKKNLLLENKLATKKQTWTLKMNTQTKMGLICKTISWAFVW